MEKPKLDFSKPSKIIKIEQPVFLTESSWGDIDNIRFKRVIKSNFKLFHFLLIIIVVYFLLCLISGLVIL